MSKHMAGLVTYERYRVVIQWFRPPKHLAPPIQGFVCGFVLGAPDRLKPVVNVTPGRGADEAVSNLGYDVNP
nr:hypothetical protein [Ruegeria sp. HKCCA4812]